MVAKFRLLSLFVIANAMGSLAMILPASPADRDQGSHIARDSSPPGGGRESRSSRIGEGGEGGDLSLLVAHDVFYQNCAGGGDCGGDRGDRGKDLRPDLIGGDTPPALLPFGGSADDGRGHDGGHDGAGSAPPDNAPGGFPSALFPFMPPTPFADAPGGGSGGGRSGGAGSGSGGPGSGGSGSGYVTSNSAAGYPGLADGNGAPGGGGDWQPIPILSSAGASAGGTSVSAADAVPEPASFPLLAGAALMFMLFRPRRRGTPD